MHNTPTNAAQRTKQKPARSHSIDQRLFLMSDRSPQPQHFVVAVGLRKVASITGLKPKLINTPPKRGNSSRSPAPSYWSVRPAAPPRRSVLLRAIVRRQKFAHRSRFVLIANIGSKGRADDFMCSVRCCLTIFLRYDKVLHIIRFLVNLVRP